MNIPPRKLSPTVWRIGGGVYAVAAWLILLVLPMGPPGLALDSSWQAILHHAAMLRWQSGVEVVFTYGPLGYLQRAALYTPGTYLACTTYQLIYKAFYVGLIFHLARRLPRSAASAFVLANTLMPALDEDSIYLLTVAYAGVVLCGRTRADRFWSWPALAFVAIGGLMKEVLLIYGAFLLAGVSAHLLLRRRRLDVLLLLGCFGLFFVGSDLWIAGQSWRNLPAFLRNSWEIVSGYPAAMAICPLSMLSLVVSVLVAAVVGLRLAYFALRGRCWTLWLIWGAGLFLAWKQGFSRADTAHQMTFLTYAVAIDAAVSVFLARAVTRSVAAALLRQTSLLVPMLVALAVLQNPAWIFDERNVLQQQVAANIRWLAKPGWERARLEALVREEARQADLPRCRAAIGNATVDMFGYEQEILLLNKWNYHPAPIAQSYCAYTPRLIDLNTSYYQSAHGPAFVLYRATKNVDDHFPTLENARVFTVLWRHYQPLFVEKGFLLLRREPLAAVEPAPPLLTNGTLVGGEKLLLPKLGGAVWCEMDLRPNLLGRIVGFFFQPPHYYLEVFSPGSVSARRYRLVPGMAAAGFLLTPLVASADDFLQLQAGHPAASQEIAAIAVRSSAVSRWLTQSRTPYRLYRLSR